MHLQSFGYFDLSSLCPTPRGNYTECGVGAGRAGDSRACLPRGHQKFYLSKQARFTDPTGCERVGQMLSLPAAIIIMNNNDSVSAAVRSVLKFVLHFAEETDALVEPDGQIRLHLVAFHAIKP